MFVLFKVKAVSRDPGNRSKVAVYSKNPDIDPVGSCVGSKGIRIKNIINEMNGEKKSYEQRKNIDKKCCFNSF